ncbi:MAG TPA: DUF4129 domain-containing protein [Chthonomonadaceae bacterium]|nr:DUF4129 domain-containing protein [Chthonomonadaceae bacterium]
MALALVLCLGLSAAARIAAQAAPPSRPAPAQVRAELDRILSCPEFQPHVVSGPNPLEKALKWIGEQWDAFWEFIRKLLSFGGIRGGSAGLQWVLIGAFILLGAWLLSKLIRSYLAHSQGRRTPPRTASTYEEELEAETITEPDIWLEQAQRYAAERDYRRAFRAVYLAILLQMDRARAIQYDRSRTNGDYIRMLRGQGLGDLYNVFVPLSAEFDLRWYGHRPTAEADYRRCLEAYGRIRGLLSTAALSAAGAGAGPALAGGRG